MSRWWSRVGAFVTRLPVAFALLGFAVAALVFQVAFLKDHMTIKVEASDLLPTDHPKNTEFEFIRDHFAGSSRGFFVVVEAPLDRLREVVPTIAARYEKMPSVEFVRWRLEREYFEDNVLLFQSQADLDKQLDHLTKNRKDLETVIGRTSSLAALLDGVADIIEGEQSDLGDAVVDEREKDQKLTRDVTTLAPLLDAVPGHLASIAAGHRLDPRALGTPLSELLQRGWFDRQDQQDVDRELLVPEDVWTKPGSRRSR